MSRPELSGRELLGEWRKVMDSVVAAAASVEGHTPIPHQVIQAMQRQLELVQEVVERERTLQKELARHIFAPVDAIFDLLEESGVMLRRQAEALEVAGRALQDTAGLVKTQGPAQCSQFRSRRFGLGLAPTDHAGDVKR